jgi:hypothetical protein
MHDTFVIECGKRVVGWIPDDTVDGTGPGDSGMLEPVWR